MPELRQKIQSTGGRITYTTESVRSRIFLHAQPILGVIHPASWYLLDLRLTAQRDGDTWGCQLLDLAGGDGITSDAGRGLAIGAALAQLACHAGDGFHPLHAAAGVGAQYERRAYAALAEQYEREALVLRGPMKRGSRTFC